MSKPSAKQLLQLRRATVKRLDACPRVTPGCQLARYEMTGDWIIAYLRAIGEVHVAQAWEDALER